MLIKSKIAQLIGEALQKAQDTKLLPSGITAEVVVEYPESPEHGDYASGLPLKLARAARMNPFAIAQALASLVKLEEPVQKVWAAPPGFINLSLNESWLTHRVEAILQQGAEYGDLDIGQGKPVQVEFVSVNPTGPVHVGHTRGAVLGSGIASILTAAGYRVTREYYVNDAGSQMGAFYRTLYARYLQALGQEAPLPADAYRGEYMIQLAKEILAQEGPRFRDLPEPEAIKELGALGLERMLSSIREDLEKVKVRFDVWFRENSLYRGHEYNTAMETLQKKGYLAQREGATWFVSTALGEDKDNVLVRTGGAPTYFASDIAYHYNKFLERGFHQVINIWGADHQGHVSRMKAAVEALGVDPQRLSVIIAQMVTLKRGEELVKASKRAGEFITLRELVDEVGADACRFFFLARTAESQMDFDLELAKKESAENPVYYVQYAHARIASILRVAAERHIDYSDGDASLLTHPAELALLKMMARLPELVDSCARNLEPHHLPRYAQELATAFHWFYKNCRVVSSEPQDTELTMARLKLVHAAKITLAKALTLMGMSAPEQM